MGESRVRYHLLALAVVLVWGVTFVCTKVLIGAGLHPVDIFWIRFVLAYAGIWLYILLTGRDRTLWYGWKEELVFLFLGITGGSFYFLTENTALAHTQASNVSFLVCSAPLFTALFTLLYRRFGKGRFADALEKVRLGWPLIGGTVLALSGMALVAFEGSRLRVSPIGDLLAIGAALCWALYSLFMGEMTNRYGTVTATRKVFFYGLLTIIPFLFGSDRGFSLELLRPFPVWGNLLFLGLVASLACFIAWNLVIDKLGNVSSTNYVYLNPVFTLLTATLFLGERMTPLSALGEKLCGVQLKNIGARLFISGICVEELFGDVDFTDGGLEGPLGFALSRKCVKALLSGNKACIELDLKSGVPEAEFSARVTALWKEQGGRLRSVLARLLPRELIAAFIAVHGSTVKGPGALAAALRAWRFPIAGYVGYERAVVTAGGIPTAEVNPKTMESRLQAGLFLCGELLDIDCTTGGYNIQTAFSTGALAGKSAVLQTN